MSNPDPVDPLRPKKPGGMRAGAVAAVLAHLVLIGAITLAVNWRSSTPEGVSAELWAATPQEAAPRGEPPPPAPAPAPAPAPEPPKPAPKPEPAPPPPRDTRAERDAQIAVEKARREKEKAEREAEERREREKAEKLADARREKERQQKEKDKAEKAEQERREQQLAKEQAAKEKAEREKAEKAEKAADAKREQLRKEQLARMMGQAGATGGPEARGTAQTTAGPSASYAGRIIARVRPNIVLTDDVPGDPVAEVEVRAGPDGTIVGRKLVKSSGVKSWDDAVLRAIDRTETLPRDVDGRVPSSMIIAFRRGA